MRFNGMVNVEIVLMVIAVQAYIRIDFAAFLRTYIQMQVDHAVALVDRRQSDLIIACLIERCTVEIECSVEADGIINIRFENRIHGQLNRGHTVAIVHILVVTDQRVNATLYERGVKTVFVVTAVLAGGIRECHGACRVHRDVQRDGAVATVDGLLMLI